MIQRYIKRSTKILEDCDDARTAFIQETRNLEEYIEHETSKKCFNSFISGAVISALIFGIISYVFMSDYGEFAKGLLNGINGF